MNIPVFIKDALLVPFIAFLIPIMWELATVPISYLKEWRMRKSSILEIDLKLDTELIQTKNIHFKCLLVRYGTDHYIKDMASDREKHDGRLRNTIIEGTITNKFLHYHIPLHRRIWTQFKCFLEVDTKENADKIMANKDAYKNIYDLGFSGSNNKNRIFFLLRDYGTTETVDGFKNNMLFPV